MIVLILIPIWLLGWIGVSVLACPYLNFIHGSQAIGCAAAVAGGGGVGLPVVAGVLLALYQHRRRRAARVRRD